MRGTAMKATNSSHHGKRLFITRSTPGERWLFRLSARREHPAEGPGCLSATLAEPPAGDPLERLGGHVAAHLGVAPLALDELDRHLGHPQARPQGPKGRVGLEHVAGGLDRCE